MNFVEIHSSAKWEVCISFLVSIIVGAFWRTTPIRSSFLQFAELHLSTVHKFQPGELNKWIRDRFSQWHSCGGLTYQLQPFSFFHFPILYLSANKEIRRTQLNEHVRMQVLTPECPHLFNTTTYETTHLLLHVLVYLQFRSGRLCNRTRYPGATKTYLNVLLTGL